MSQSLKFVQEHLDEAAPTDVSEVFGAWQELVERLRAKVAARFELERDPSTEVLEDFGSDDGPRGRVRAYSGPEVDWMVHSWHGQRRASFANLHLTVWLGPQVKVPAPRHGAAGAGPQGWFYLDSVPRSYMVDDAEYYDRYYEPVNERVGAGAPSRPRVRVLRQPRRLHPGQPLADRLLLLVSGRPSATSTW